MVCPLWLKTSQNECGQMMPCMRRAVHAQTCEVTRGPVLTSTITGGLTGDTLLGPHR